MLAVLLLMGVESPCMTSCVLVVNDHRAAERDSARQLLCWGHLYLGIALAQLTIHNHCRHKKKETDLQTGRQCVCVCVCVPFDAWAKEDGKRRRNNLFFGSAASLIQPRACTHVVCWLFVLVSPAPSPSFPFHLHSPPTAPASATSRGSSMSSGPSAARHTNLQPLCTAYSNTLAAGSRRQKSLPAPSPLFFCCCCCFAVLLTVPALCVSVCCDVYAF